ncbi:MAG: hypothetical protein K2Y27_34945 [Xanthobacteraceae bacterium]|nr:hypothetical protein [Xanthobacteraceae bacterium]
MRIDNYTKFLLTVMACALLVLVVLVARNGNSRVNLQGRSFDKIQLCDSKIGCIEFFNVTIDSCEQKPAGDHLSSLILRRM